MSDGAYANGCGIVTRSDEDGLVPAAAISRLVKVAPDHVGLWVEAFGALEPESREDRLDGQAVRSFAAFGSAVLLTPMVDAVGDCLVPVPAAFDAGGERFEVWETFKEGAVRFCTFGRWLESTIATHWVARDDELVRRLLPDVTEHMGAIDRWAAAPDFHWYAVRQARRLAAAPPDDRRVAPALERLWNGNDPYLRGGHFADLRRPGAPHEHMSGGAVPGPGFRAVRRRPLGDTGEGTPWMRNGVTVFLLSPGPGAKS